MNADIFPAVEILSESRKPEIRLRSQARKRVKKKSGGM